MSSEAAGSSKPKQQLNISAKEWVPSKSIINLPQHSAGAVNTTGNIYDNSHDVVIFHLY